MALSTNFLGGGLPKTTTKKRGFPDFREDAGDNRALQIQNGAAIRSLSPGVAPLNTEIPGLAGKTFGGILRYPYEALTDDTDYLQIDIRAYNPIASRSANNSIVSNGRSIRKPDIGFTEFDLSKLIGGKKLQTKKLKSGQGTIFLPMPSNIQDGNSVSFSSGNLDGITAQLYDGVSRTINAGGNKIDDILKSATEEAKNLGNKFLTNPALKDVILTDLAAQAANIPVGGSLTRDAVFARTRGEILNQNVELLFNGVTLRSFKFSFKLTPRNKDEALQIKLIINAFKKNMAAKSGGIDGTGDGTFLGTPNVFELFYKRGNTRHPFLHSFKQCVLTEMSVNYTGEGTYAVYDDSTPVSMVLELGFKELEPIYDTDYGSEPGVGY
jgi:hypothetical protein